MTTDTTTGLGRRLVDRFFLGATVAELELLTPRLLAVALTGPALRDLDWTPGQQVRVQVGGSGMLGALRTYSVWDYRETILELRIYLHGSGQGADWARRVRVGDRVSLRPPEGRFVTHPGAYHLFAGEDTAAVAFGAMLRELDLAVPVHGVLETETAADRLSLPRAGELTWISRDGGSAADSARLVEAVAALELPDQPGLAYLAGEARTCQMVRRHLVAERGWPRRSVLVKPFWAPGRRGMD
ncbi:MAG TPA: siderophore-interacting protein [Pseudonocardiaceae bacterium]|jgi:NADPH-dependent ferric siderophore reductase|nr:siderophore-interacting protein [Pseudonocardiaceae bacterium]